MARFVLNFIVLFVLVSCNNETKIVEVVLDESIIPDNAKNVSLRPTFGFNSVYGGIRTLYTIYCDTLTPPTQIAASTSASIFNLMCNDSKMLKPNKKYYWYCRADKDGESFPTDIFSFTTIDTNILNSNQWQLQHILSKSDYEEKSARDYYTYDLPDSSCLIYSEPYVFTILDDSVKNVYRYKVYNGISNPLPSSGLYSFSFNDVSILDWKYQFINLGVNYYDSNNIQANQIFFVLKQLNSNNILVFNKTN